MGKGSTRRPGNEAALRANWDRVFDAQKERHAETSSFGFVVTNEDEIRAPTRRPTEYEQKRIDEYRRMYKNAFDGFAPEGVHILPGDFANDSLTVFLPAEG